MTENLNVARSTVSPRRLLIPLALAQFVCSFAGSNMNVAISSISKELGTRRSGRGADRDHERSCSSWRRS